MKLLDPISFPTLANTAYFFTDTISKAGGILTNLPFVGAYSLVR